MSLSLPCRNYSQTSQLQHFCIIYFISVQTTFFYIFATQTLNEMILFLKWFAATFREVIYKVLAHTFVADAEMQFLRFYARKLLSVAVVVQVIKSVL